MAIRITHVRIPSNGTGNESITDYKWINDTNANSGSSTKVAMVDWLDQKGNSAYVSNGVGHVSVGVVRPKLGSPYLRTYANGVWTDNLLSLPRF